MNTLFILLFALNLKHFIADFLLQPPFMYLNKGTYGHVGGISHSMLHSLMTMFIIASMAKLMALSVTPMLCVLIGIIEFIVHYHTDWAKVNLTKKYNLSPTNSEKYWWLLGADQLIHALTYLLIAIIIF